MYERTYLKLSQEFPEQEYRRLMEKESIKKLLGTSISRKADSDAIRDSLIQKCASLGADTSVNDWSIKNLLDYYIEHVDTDSQFRKSVIPFLTADQIVRLNSNLLSLM